MENSAFSNTPEQDFYEQLCSLENLELAFEKARKGKSSKLYVVEFAKELKYGKTEYHPEEQWLLVAWDCDKQAERTFAMKDVREWQAQRISPSENTNAL